MRKRLRWWLPAVVVVATVLVLGRQPLLNRFDLYLGNRALADLEFARATELGERVLERDPVSAEGLLLAGRGQAGLRQHDRALATFDQVPDERGDTAVAARLAAGDILLRRLHQLSAAEQQFRRARGLRPDQRVANDRLAYILGIGSRRWESTGPRLTICRLDDFTPLHLRVLAIGKEGVVAPEMIETFHRADPDDPAVLLTMAWLAIGDSDTPRAERLLRQAVTSQPALAEAQAVLGTLLVDSDRDPGFLAWHAALPASADRHPRIWYVRGTWLARHERPRQAVRCFVESIRRDPNHQQANYRLGLLLSRIGQPDQAAPFLERSSQLDEYATAIKMSWATRSPTDVQRAAELAESLGLLWEAYGLARWGQQLLPAAAWAGRLTASLAPRLDELPLSRSVAEANPARRFGIETFALPDWPGPPAGPVEPSAPDAIGSIRFADQAEQAGLRFTYRNDSTPGRDGLSRMYESTGGGSAAIDFDRDGWPDVYLVQGGRFAAKERSSDDQDCLFRNLGTGRFDDVTGQAGLVAGGFGQGATVGDIDGDGFPDLFVTNIGGNRLWHNNGDGTFSDVTAGSGIEGDCWSTSCLLADLNGDGLPDLYCVNFLGGPDVFTRDCRAFRGAAVLPGGRNPGLAPGNGAPDSTRPRSDARSCSPLDFPAEQDQLYVNRGDGRFDNVTTTSGISTPHGKGLGIVAADFSGQGLLSLFVANDSVPNFLFVNRMTGPDDRLTFSEQAMSLGLAVDRDGRSEACMGVAAGDANGDGTIDLLVTNFLNESNTLYRGLPGQLFFTDSTQRAGLSSPSLGMLGFGTQFVDGELDGRLDLLVTNGHIDVDQDARGPYRMRPQYFGNLGTGRFRELPASQLGTFFERRFLGRGMTRLDWNRDGADDVIISHINAPAALLTNQTPNRGRSLSVRLVGTRSNRDAIGTVVTLYVDDRSLVRQLTAGDGYLASNQRQLVFGLGEATRVDRLEVRWPSGKTETLSGLAVDREVMVIEGVGRASELPR